VAANSLKVSPGLFSEAASASSLPYVRSVQTGGRGEKKLRRFAKPRCMIPLTTAES
jgi:hypothetical protein